MWLWNIGMTLLYKNIRFFFFSSNGVENGVGAREIERERQKHIDTDGDYDDDELLYWPFLIFLCFTQSQGERFFFMNEMFPNGLRQGPTWSPTATERPQNSRLLTDDCRITPIPPGHARWQLYVTDWILSGCKIETDRNPLGTRRIYHFIMPTQCYSGSDSGEMLLLVFTCVSYNHFVYTAGTSVFVNSYDAISVILLIYIYNIYIYIYSSTIYIYYFYTYSYNSGCVKINRLCNL